MVEPHTKTCARCEDEFDIEEHYRVVHVTDHPHPDDVEIGDDKEEESYVLCGPCAVDFRVWLNPDVDSFEELHPESAEELFSDSGSED